MSGSSVTLQELHGGMLNGQTDSSLRPGCNLQINAPTSEMPPKYRVSNTPDAAVYVALLLLQFGDVRLEDCVWLPGRCRILA